jgi:iduronate 2-sulfatase
VKLHIIFALFAGSTLAVEYHISKAAEFDRPNVLFIAVDDLNATLGCYGNTEAQTPNIDRLALRGVQFNHAYCQQAVCNPSRASLMTGRRPDTLKVWDLRTHFRKELPDVVTLPEHFKNNGYDTRCVGKIYHNYPKGMQDPQSWSAAAEFEWGRHSDEYAFAKSVDGKPSPKREITERLDVPDETYRDGKIASRAIEVLAEIKDRPFFLAVGFWRPHTPMLAPKIYWDLYEREELKPPFDPRPPRDVPDIAPHDNREIRGYEGVVTDGKITHETTMKIRHGYLASITYLDAQIGRVLDELDRLKLTERTIVIFWSDHGFHLGEHGLWCKTSNFELDARVPLIIVDPRREATRHVERKPTKTDAIVELLDVYPTLVELCGLPKAKGLEGTNLAPILSDPSKPGKQAALTQHPRPAYYKGSPDVMGYSIRTPQFRFTQWREFQTGKVVAEELYDHSTDSHETKNVVSAVENVTVVMQHRQRLNSLVDLSRKTSKTSN